jgi:SagB-type dehydrogenase family enzyme
MRKVQLLRELADSGLSVEKTIAKRRSERNFSRKPMSLAELSHILYYSGGITDKRSGSRASPSAGATYPLEVYPVINNVEGLPLGIYRYLIESHELELTREGDFRRGMAQAALEQRMLIEANVVLVLSAVFERTTRRYRERGHRYILLEAGHVAQNTCLVATSMGLGTCAIGAFYDDEFNRLLGLDGRKESVLYLVAVGKM